MRVKNSGAFHTPTPSLCNAPAPVNVRGMLYTFSMEANRVGRTVGIGTRLLARLVREKAVEGAARTAAHIEKQAPVYKERGRNLAEGSRRLGEGSRRFGRSIWGPFAHASRILWLEITGIFFAVFTIFFGGNAWRIRADWKTGPSHQRFILYVVITLVFLYFTISSFLRASRQNRAKKQ